MRLYEAGAPTSNTDWRDAYCVPMSWKSVRVREAALTVSLWLSMVLAIVVPPYVDRLWAVVFFAPFAVLLFHGYRWFDVPSDRSM